MLDLGSLVVLARTVGFAERDVATAAACAWAASRGRPAFVHTVGPPGVAGPYVGLWAVDVNEHAPGRFDLTAPKDAAYHALDLTNAHGGFGWCAAYRTGAYLPHVEDARTAATYADYRQPVTRPTSVPRTRDHMGELRSALRRIATNAIERSRRGYR